MTTMPNTTWLASCTVCGASEHTATHDQAVAWTLQHVDECPDCACEVRPDRPGWWELFASAQLDESAQLSDVAPPAGSVHVDDWHDVGRESCGRCFTGPSWIVERDKDADVEVLINGIQHPSGRVERFITVTEGNYERLTELTSTDARQLARALIAAAEEATEHDDDRLAIYAATSGPQRALLRQQLEM